MSWSDWLLVGTMIAVGIWYLIAGPLIVDHLDQRDYEEATK